MLSTCRGFFCCARHCQATRKTSGSPECSDIAIVEENLAQEFEAVPDMVDCSRNDCGTRIAFARRPRTATAGQRTSARPKRFQEKRWNMLWGCWQSRRSQSGARRIHLRRALGNDSSQRQHDECTAKSCLDAASSRASCEAALLKAAASLAVLPASGNHDPLASGMRFT